jgi:hypothetical protein
VISELIIKQPLKKKVETEKQITEWCETLNK